MDGYHVAIACTFEFSRKKILVLSYHGPWNKKRGAMLVWQTVAILKSIQRIVETEGNVDCVVLAGDFNMSPSSIVYQHILGSPLDFNFQIEQNLISGLHNNK